MKRKKLTRMKGPEVNLSVLTLGQMGLKGLKENECSKGQKVSHTQKQKFIKKTNFKDSQHQLNYKH